MAKQRAQSWNNLYNKHTLNQIHRRLKVAWSSDESFYEVGAFLVLLIFYLSVKHYEDAKQATQKCKNIKNDSDHGCGKHFLYFSLAFTFKAQNFKRIGGEVYINQKQPKIEYRIQNKYELPTIQFKGLICR